MHKIQKTDSSNPDFVELVKQLDTLLLAVDGDEDHVFYSKFNKIDLNNVLILYENEIAVACGAIKPFDQNSMEIKRMFVLPSYRGKGLATKILVELEHWTKDLGFSRCVLETGVKLEAAIALYEKNGYELIPNYGQYVGVEISVCFGKRV